MFANGTVPEEVAGVIRRCEEEIGPIIKIGDLIERVVGHDFFLYPHYAESPVGPTFTLNNDNENARQEAMFGEVVTARYVEFTTEDNFFVAPGDGSAGGVAGGDRVGLGEIAFSVVPEPSSILLLLTAFVGMLGLRRQK